MQISTENVQINKIFMEEFLHPEEALYSPSAARCMEERIPSSFSAIGLLALPLNLAVVPTLQSTRFNL